MHYRPVVCLALLLTMAGCARHHYRLRADRQTYGILREKAAHTPWEPPIRYSVQPDPRSRFFNPTKIDDPALPLPAPQLYAYEIPNLADDFGAPVVCQTDKESTGKLAVAPDSITTPQQTADAPGDKVKKIRIQSVGWKQPAGDKAPSDTNPPLVAQTLQVEQASNVVDEHDQIPKSAKIKLVSFEAVPTPGKSADETAEPQVLPEIETVAQQVEDPRRRTEEDEDEGLYPSNSSAAELRVVEIPPSAWESLPESCLFRMFEFESIRDEYEQTYKTGPSAQQRDQSQRLTLRDIVKLAQINSREYQTQKETLYNVALRLTFERYQYQLKFAPAGNGTDVEYLHSASDLTSFERLGIGTRFAMTKVLATGGDLLARFANDVILTFNGPDGFAADVSSEMLFSVAQPILQRDIVFENLTQAERDVVYAARDFARFRKQLFRDLALQYYNLLLSYRQIEIAAQNYFSNVRGFEQGLAEYRAGRLPRFQVDQFEQDALSARNTLIVRCNSLEQSLDQLKLLIGLPTETPLNLNLLELEDLTLRDEIQVSLEQVLRARRNLTSEMRRSEPDQSVLLNGGVDLTRRMLRVLELRRKLGMETPQQKPLEQRLARLLAREARMLVQFNREALEEEREANPPAPPVRIFQRTLELVDSMLLLVDRQIELARLSDSDSAELQHPANRASELRRRLQELGVRLEDVVRDRELNRIPDLVVQADALLAEAEELRSQTEKRDPDDSSATRADIEETLATINDLMRQSQELASEESAALSPVTIDMDDAMMTALLLRFDLMNQRGFLADAWRQIKLAADDLKSVLNLNASHRLRTEKNRPFGFTLEESETQLNLSFDAPLNRRAQRNDYRRALIGFQASQRDLIALEDRIKFAVRNDLRQLQLDQEQYDIAVASAALAFERVVSTRLQLQLGVENVAARDVLEAQRAFTQSLSSVASAHITYILDRTDLFLDLEELWVDDDGFWPALYQPEVQPQPHHQFPEYAMPVYGTLPDRVWYSKKIKRMLKVPPGEARIYSPGTPQAAPLQSKEEEPAEPAETTPEP